MTKQCNRTLLEPYELTNTSISPTNDNLPETAHRRDGDLVDAIRQLILGSTRPAAEPLAEAALARRFGVSRTPIREALKQLQTERLVDIRPRVGTFIREPTRRELAELFEVKEMLEGLAARLAAGRGGISELDELANNITKSRQAALASDHEAYAELAQEFHAVLIRAADSIKLSEQYQILMNQMAYRRLILGTVTRPGRIAVSLAEHERIFEQIVNKDPYGSEAVTRSHVQSSLREDFLDYVAANAWPDAGTPPTTPYFSSNSVK